MVKSGGGAASRGAEALIAQRLLRPPAQADGGGDGDGGGGGGGGGGAVGANLADYLDEAELTYERLIELDEAGGEDVSSSATKEMTFRCSRQSRSSL